MTNNNEFERTWNDDRLNQLATNVEYNTISISELRNAAEALLQIARIHQHDIEILSRDMQCLKLEVQRLVEE